MLNKSTSRGSTCDCSAASELSEALSTASRLLCSKFTQLNGEKARGPGGQAEALWLIYCSGDSAIRISGSSHSVADKNICLFQGCRRMVTPLHCWWGCKIVQPLCKKFGNFLKSKTHTYHKNITSARLGFYSREKKSPCKDLYMSVHSSFIYYSPKLERSQLSISNWISK